MRQFSFCSLPVKVNKRILTCVDVNVPPFAFVYPPFSTYFEYHTYWQTCKSKLKPSLLLSFHLYLNQSKRDLTIDNLRHFFRIYAIPKIKSETKSYYKSMKLKYFLFFKNEIRPNNIELVHILLKGTFYPHTHLQFFKSLEKQIAK